MVGISKFGRSYVRKRATQRQDDACKIWKPGPVVVDKSTGKSSRSVLQVKYEGPCRFWEVTAGQQIVVGDEQITMTQAYLSLPYNAPIPEADDVVEITHSDDTDLIGRTVEVISAVRGGGLRASRRLMVKVRESKKANW
jgi:hypothetical protein